MEIKWIYHNGIRILALVVNDNDPHGFCENCGKKHYSHPKLAVKEDKDGAGIVTMNIIKNICLMQK